MSFERSGDLQTVEPKKWAQSRNWYEANEVTKTKVTHCKDSTDSVRTADHHL